MEKYSNKKILAIGAHPDDIEYYAGGTLLKLAKRNRLVYVVVTNGEIGGSPWPRKREQKEAAKLVGVKKLILLNYLDSSLGTKSEALKQDLLKIILEENPDVVFSFDPENQFRFQFDLHPDHRFLSLLVTDLILIYSTLPAYIKKINPKLKPLHNKPELWLFNSQNPNHFEDVTSFWNKKRELLKTFKSQKLSCETLAVEARKFGRILGVKYAEGFNRINFYSKINV